MKKVLVGLPMETKVRDLDGRLYLASRLVSAGFRCCVGHRNDVQDYLIKEGGPAAYLDKGGAANDLRMSLFRRFQERGCDIIRMDEEGGIYTSNCNALRHRNPPDVMELSRQTLLWGEWQKSELLKSDESIEETKIQVTGNSRFDLCKRTFGPYFRDQPIADEFRRDPYLLVNTSFQRANHYLGAEGLRAKRSQVMGQAYDNLHEDMLHHYHGLVSRFFIEALRPLAAAIAPRLIVIRPHPTESLKFYRQAFGDLANVRVLREGPVQCWLVNAGAVLHHGCTTAVESFIHGLPVAMYTPIYHPEMAKPLPLSISDRIDNAEALNAWVKQALNGEYRLPEVTLQKRIECLKPVIANTDFSATDRIVKLFMTWYGDGDLPTSTDSYSTRESCRRSYRCMVGKLRNKGINGRLLRMRSISRYKFDRLTDDEVTARLRSFRKVDAKVRDISCKQVASDAYLLDAGDDI